ncbi:MAG: LysM peptidoglycan-binding domain-containing protein [Bacilli bacterium]
MKRVHKKRKTVRRREKLKIYMKLKLVAMLLVLGLGVLVGYSFKDNDKIVVYEKYTVGSGDTIYEIAKEYTEDDPRKLVYEIKRVNDIQDSRITPNQVLNIPIER